MTKWVIGIGKSKKDRQYNDQMKKDKKTNNDLLILSLVILLIAYIAFN